MTEIASNFPTSDPEYVPTEEIDEIRRANHNTMLINYLENCDVFRATLFRKLNRHNAIENGKTITVFQIDKDCSGSVATADGKKDVMVICLPYFGSITKEGYRIPTIRLYTQEWVEDEHGNGDFVCYDVSLDCENDAQFYVASSHYMDNLREELNPTDPSFGVGGSHAFTLDAQTFQPNLVEGKLHFSHTPEVFTGAVPVFGKNDEGFIERTMPFGHWSNLADRRQALEVGFNILAEIESIDPILYTTSW